MITVAILINGNPIMSRSAHRISGNPGEVCTYFCDDGSEITHNYDDGAVKLAHKLLDRIQTKSVYEQKRDEFFKFAEQYLKEEK